jgi:hypothetical protein
MIIVVSQAWTKEGEEHAQEYVRLSEEFGRFFDDHPGFHRRLLVRGVDDPTHFINLRFFDKVQDYEDCTKREGYVAHTEAMYEHMRPYDSYPREYVEVVLDSGPGASADLGLPSAPPA